MKKRALIISISVTAAAILVGFVYLLISNSSGADVELKKYTPAQILNLYIDALNAGDCGTLNRIVSKRWLDSYGPYKRLPRQKLTDVEIKPFDAEKYLNPDLAERYRDAPATQCYYILEFTVEESGEHSWFAHGERPMYFAKLVLEDDIWKIDELATSP